MADARIIEIADEIVAHLDEASLDEASLSQTVTAVRGYRPQYELVDAKTLHVTVIPKAIETSIGSREADDQDYRVDVAVQQRFENPENAELDPLLYLVQEIRELFRGWTGATSGAICMGSINEPAWVPEHLLAWGQFTSVLTLRFFYSG